jgi:hypothetical protein
MNVSVRDETATHPIGAGLHRTPQFILRKAGGLCLGRAEPQRMLSDRRSRSGLDCSLAGIFFGLIPLPITDLKIAGLRRRDGRKQSAIGFEIEQWCAV